MDADRSTTPNTSGAAGNVPDGTNPQGPPGASAGPPSPTVILDAIAASWPSPLREAVARELLATNAGAQPPSTSSEDPAATAAAAAATTTAALRNLSLVPDAGVNYVTAWMAGAELAAEEMASREFEASARDARTARETRTRARRERLIRMKRCESDEEAIRQEEAKEDEEEMEEIMAGGPVGRSQLSQQGIRALADAGLLR